MILLSWAVVSVERDVRGVAGDVVGQVGGARDVEVVGFYGDIGGEVVAGVADDFDDPNAPRAVG